MQLPFPGVITCVSSNVSLEQWFFSHFQLLEEDINLVRMAVTVWSIWIPRSDRLWNNGSMPSHIASSQDRPGFSQHLDCCWATTGAFEPRMVEALALTGVLEKLHTLGFNNIIIESDAKALGNNRKTLYVQRDLPINRWNQLLLGMLRGRRPAFGVSNKRSVSLRCRAQSKPRALVSGSVDEQSSLIEKPAQELIHFYRIPLIQESATLELLKSVQTKVSNKIVGLRTEQCFNIGIRSGISSQKLGVLRWLLQETYEPENLGTESFLEKKMKEGVNAVIVEAGPRLSFTTAWSANAVSICHASGLTEVTRLERPRRYLLYSKGVLQDYQINEFAAMVHDRMTECVYTQKLTSFETSVVPEEVRYVPVMERGRKALEEINQEMGLAFDEQDLQYYTSLFREDIKRNPTTVELFDIAQSNSEHSRHWFFTGKIIIDGQPMNRTLMQIVKSTLQANPNNSVIGFKDNSSAIKGLPVKQLRPVQPGSTCPLNASNRDLDILFTAETHNFPCAVAPHPGAETGAGGCRGSN
ncbi:hypothetical protein Peur_043192 [Populus x canadensis]